MSTKPQFPGCQQALSKYYELKKRLHNFFFNGVELKITKSEAVLAYSDVYNLIDKNSQVKLQNQKKYQIYQETFFNTFKNDLTFFCNQVRQILIAKKGISSPVDQLRYYYQWIINYTFFLAWTYKMLSSIEKNITVFNRTTLYFTGLTIIRQQIIQPLYSEIFRLIMSNLQLFKEEQLEQYSELQFVIQMIGMCGFTKYFCVKLERNTSGFYQFHSFSKQNNLKTEDEYQTDYFQRRFTNQYVKYLKNKYQKISQEMLKLSTSQYVNKTTEYLQKQTKAAQFFYSCSKVKNSIIRSIQQTLITNNCKQLIYKPNSGLHFMVESDDIQGLRELYKLTKRTSQQKLFGQCYQQCIQKHISQQMLTKLTPQDQKMAKKQVVFALINSLYDYYIKIEKITKLVQQYQKDPFDLILVTCQSNGFQQACNKNNTVCNFLAHYCDTILKKQPNAADVTVKQLTMRVSKMLKFMYSLDQFLKVYQKMLGIRILYDNFKNKEVQMEIINMMKSQVGIATLSKITTIIQDYKFSQNFNSQKSILFRNKLPFNFQVTMVTSGAWQVQDLKNNKKLVPPQLTRAVQIFQNQYNQTFPGREITWVFNYGRAVVQVKFNQQQKVLLMVNNYQLLILLYLQRKNFETVKIIQVLSELKPEQEPAFMASIMMLVKKGVLLKDGSQQKIQSKNETVRLNLDLKLKVPKLGCFEVPRYIEKSPAVSNQLNAQRAFIVQANIVKLMKMKRILRYQQILSEVTAMCKTFKADVALIKNQIQNCIHKQFLERDQKDFNNLIYKP